ncbi:Hypothetical predicted protein [Pelobates cultripes]|uniref:Uncharacterized protein n=1 Tax=Pelobates cultripes TaxID=61616 RepID=A0AAD1VLG0_PELCU|nr:Hypothetical predicted protein [Pelobates cultripes]
MAPLHSWRKVHWNWASTDQIPDIRRVPTQQLTYRDESGRDTSPALGPQLTTHYITAKRGEVNASARVKAGKPQARETKHAPQLTTSNSPPEQDQGRRATHMQGPSGVK